MDPQEQRATEDIEQQGCHILYILEEEDLPPFAYSIGIMKKTGRPELVVVGLGQEASTFVINEYNRRAQAGEAFTPGEFYGGFLEGFDCTFEPVSRNHYNEHFGWARWLYSGYDFEVLQLVYPTTSGIWPWSPGAPEAFLMRQPILTDTGASSIQA